MNEQRKLPIGSLTPFSMLLCANWRMRIFLSLMRFRELLRLPKDCDTWSARADRIQVLEPEKAIRFLTY